MQDWKYNENWSEAEITPDEKFTFTFVDEIQAEALELLFSGRADLDAMIHGFKSIVTRLESEKAQIREDMDAVWPSAFPE